MVRGDIVEIFGGDVEVAADERVTGNVVCIGGDVTIHGRVDGYVTVIAGDLRLNGEVGESIVTVFSEVGLNGRADESVVNVLGRMDERGADVGGDLIDISPGGGLSRSDLGLLLLLFRGAHKVAIFLLLLLLVAMAPRRIRAMADEAPVRYISAFFVGLLGYLFFWVISLVLLPTVLGTVVAWVGFVVLKWLGVAALFLTLGRRLIQPFGARDPFLGAILLVFLLYSAVHLSPSFAGWLGLLLSLVLRLVFFLFFEAPAIGLVLLTGVGGKAQAGAPPALGSPSGPAPPRTDAGGSPVPA